uniref:Protein mesh n=1 Tax=Ascaris suum TaxID=6253 RepID=F1KRK1_ASCSU
MGNSMVRILHHTVRCLFVASISFAQLEPSQNLQGIQNVDYARAAYGAYNPYYPEKPNLVEYGADVGDMEISSNQQANGMTIRLYQYFPFYSGKYNYTMISTNGYIGFAHFSDNAHDLRVGTDTDWPRESDPALIAPYLCKQRVDANTLTSSKVFYRLEMRSHSALSSAVSHTRGTCRGKLPYVQCNMQSDLFLDRMQRMLQEGVAGASVFRAEAALVVTWENLRPNIGRERTYSTYQLVWLTDALGTLSYTIINYDKLGYDAADLNGNTLTGRCQAVFNGGNHTGSVMVDLSVTTKERPSSLADRSSVPHVVRGRYLHRVDDIVRPAGCSNKTGGTFPLNIYPNIVNMLGQMTVDVNGMCLDPSTTYVLMIEQRETAPCEVLNAAIARCRLPKILDWGTKTVYLQPQSGLANDEKAYIGYIYFVPPTIDPMRLDIGNVHDWFRNPVKDDKEIVWYPRNFTSPQTGDRTMDVNNPSLYQVTLGLYVIGYKEARDDAVKKFRPVHRVLARLSSHQNMGDEVYRWSPQKARITIQQVEEWYMDEWERENELFTYRFGYLKLSPIPSDVGADASNQRFITELPTGLISAPISLHWLWTARHSSFTAASASDIEQRKLFVKQKATEMCQSWFNEDGALPNFIRETETNSSCPCKEEQAILDIGRFMPHPRCSQIFRDVACTETLGSRNCYMSAQNVQGAHYDSNLPAAHERLHHSYSTHYGQVCCYDEQGYLMQTSYQPVIKIDESTPYSPGFPMRAYEFGTNPYQGMFEVPGLSAFHHDMMPYYLCCKYSDFRCQMFYWRRPSSACQQYEPPAIGTLMGAGIMTTLQKQKLIFNDPGIYNLLYAERTSLTPEVRIQARLERFPDRSVDFSGYNIEQFKLVQPSNATVLTGVALESSESDRVHIILRKDTRRARYRTTIMVGDVVRYFDNMQLQRFRGVTIYVNNVQRGQAEVYVVLNKAQIGVRIRESYAIDMDRLPTYMESFGLLDLLVAVPPQYHAESNLVQPRVFGEMPLIDGLLRPAGEGVYPSESDSSLSWDEVNNPGKRNDLITKYRIKGESEMGLISQSVRLSSGVAMTDMFETTSDSAFSVFPDSNMKKPVYTTDARFHSGSHAFVAQTQQTIDNFKRLCRRFYEDGMMDMSVYPEIRRCPESLQAIEIDCASDVVCEFDSLLLQARILGDKSKEEFHSFVVQRDLATTHYNSCGAVALEYPEYMIKGPSSVSAAYLEGDIVSFSCSQDHISMGDTEYQCSRVSYGHDQNSFIMRWNEGSQPWCRTRQKNDLLTWLFWIGVFFGILATLAVVFFACWSLKQRHRIRKGTRKNTISSTMKTTDIPLETMKRFEEKEPLQPPPRYERNVRRYSPTISLNDVSPLERPPISRFSSQPYLFDGEGGGFSGYGSSTGFPTPPPRRASRGGLSGLTTGV